MGGIPISGEAGDAQKNTGKWESEMRKECQQHEQRIGSHSSVEVLTESSVSHLRKECREEEKRDRARDLFG